MSGSALVKRINAQMFRTIFEMSCGYVFDDALGAERIAQLAKDRGALLSREVELEIARRRYFVPLA
jgi:hypothetical protein